MSESTSNTSSSQASGQEERAFGRMPLFPWEREYDTKGAHTSCFAYAIATWCFLTGGFVAQNVGAVQGMVCLMAGAVIGTFLTTMPLALSSQKYGLEQMDCCTPSFGTRGIKILLLFYMINMVGWSGLILVMFGNGIRNILEAIGLQPGDWVVGAGVALGTGLSYLIATKGVHLLRVSNSIITPGMGIMAVYMFYVLFTEYGWEQIAAAPPIDPEFDSPMKNYLVCVEYGIAAGISWFGGVGFLSRNTRTRRNAIYPEIIQLGLAMGVVSSIGLFSALVIQSEDPTEWMVPLGGVFLGVVALLFVAMANITSTAVSFFASGLAMRHVHIFRNIPWWQLMAVMVIPLVPFVFWPHELYEMGDAFLAFNGTMYGPISGILFADYFFLRKQKYNLWAIFDDHPSGSYHYTKGINWIAMGSLLLGQAVYIFIYNPGTGATHDLFLTINPSLAACFVPFVVYGVSMKVFGWHKRSTETDSEQQERNSRPNGQKIRISNL